MDQNSNINMNRIAAPNSRQMSRSRKEWEYQQQPQNPIALKRKANMEEKVGKEEQNRKSEINNNMQESAPTTSHRNELCMALVNERWGGDLKPVVSKWSKIESRMSDLLYKYLAHNKNSPIPRYDSGEIYKGFFLIQCKDLFSKQFLINCIAQVRNEFEDLNLNVVEVERLPSPTDWRQTTSDTNPAEVEYRRYVLTLDRLKRVEAKRQLKSADRKCIRKYKRIITEYEERNGLPPTLADSVNSFGQDPHREEGFQLSVNYFDGSRQHVAGDYSHSWDDQRYSNNYTNDDPDSRNWGGGNNSWNCEQMPRENYQQMDNNSAFNERNFEDQFSFNPENNYNSQWEPAGRSQGTWNCRAAETESFSNSRGNEEYFNNQNNFEFAGEQRSNSSWHCRDSQTESYQEMRGRNNFQDREFNETAPTFRTNEMSNSWNNDYNPDFENHHEMRGRNNFDSGFNEIRVTVPNFRANQLSRDRSNDSNPEFKSHHELRGNSNINSPQQENSFRARNNFDSQQNYGANNAWNYDKSNGGNYDSPHEQFNPQFNGHFREESENSRGSSSNRNMMSRSSWNPIDSERSLGETNSGLPHPSNTEEVSSKLEKQIFELLNTLHSNKLPNSPNEPTNERENVDDCLREHKTDLKPAEVISLTDESDQEVEGGKVEQEYFKALAYLRKLEGRAPRSLSEQDNFLKETSEFIVRQYENKFGRKQQPQEKTNERTSKRTRWSSTTNNDYAPHTAGSSNQTIPTNSVNPAFGNPSASSTYSSNKNQLQLCIAIIDRNHPDLQIPKHLWRPIEEKLFKDLQIEVEKTNNANITQFNAKPWQDGIKIIQCENLEALNFIKRFVIKFALQNPRQQYDVMPVNELPKYYIVKLYVPPTNVRDKSILKIIKEQNINLLSSNWTLRNIREAANRIGKNLFIRISAASMEKLRFARGEVRYGNERLKMESLDKGEFGEVASERGGEVC